MPLVIISRSVTFGSFILFTLQFVLGVWMKSVTFLCDCLRYVCRNLTVFLLQIFSFSVIISCTFLFSLPPLPSPLSPLPFPNFSLPISSLFSFPLLPCSLPVPSPFPPCSLPVPSLFPPCSLPVSSLATTYS